MNLNVLYLKALRPQRPNWHKSNSQRPNWYQSNSQSPTVTGTTAINQILKDLTGMKEIHYWLIHPN